MVVLVVGELRTLPDSLCFDRVVLQGRLGMPAFDGLVVTGSSPGGFGERGLVVVVVGGVFVAGVAEGVEEEGSLWRVYR
jgi:hypothetical protein